MNVTLRKYTSINNDSFNDSEIQNVSRIKPERQIEKYDIMRVITANHQSHFIKSLYTVFGRQGFMSSVVASGVCDGLQL